MERKGSAALNILRSRRTRTLLCGLIVLVISYFTYFHRYYEPKNAFYDEVYHVIGGENYIHHVMYFEVHPPVGKLFIALGETMFGQNKNINLSEPIKRGYILGDLPGNFSFVGVRFFPTLFGFLNALLLFTIFYFISKNNFISLMFSGLYLFENSTIVHFRSAMLDSTLVFFVLLSIIYFMYLYEKKKQVISLNYFVLGCLASLAIFTKIVGLILTLLFVFLIVRELRKSKNKKLSRRLKYLLKYCGAYVLGLFVICFTVYYIHVALGSNIYNGKTGTASLEYIKMVNEKDVYNPLKLFVPIRDYMRDMKIAHSNIAPLDVCKPNEPGSSPVGWPFGIKSINYLLTTGFADGTASYLTFQGNPVNWFIGIVSVFLSICLIVSCMIFRTPVTNSRTYDYIFIFTTLYVGYMAAVIWGGTHRVLYIHLYVMPLIFSFIIFFLLFNYMFERAIIKKDKIIYLAVSLLLAQVFYAYVFTYPLTYFKPVNYLECEHKRWFDFWKDHCVR